MYSQPPPLCEDDGEEDDVEETGDYWKKYKAKEERELQLRKTHERQVLHIFKPQSRPNYGLINFKTLIH